MSDVPRHSARWAAIKADPDRFAAERAKDTARHNRRMQEIKSDPAKLAEHRAKRKTRDANRRAAIQRDPTLLAKYRAQNRAQRKRRMDRDPEYRARLMARLPMLSAKSPLQLLGDPIAPRSSILDDHELLILEKLAETRSPSTVMSEFKISLPQFQTVIVNAMRRLQLHGVI